MDDGELTPEDIKQMADSLEKAPPPAMTSEEYQRRWKKGKERWKAHVKQKWDEMNAKRKAKGKPIIPFPPD